MSNFYKRLNEALEKELNLEELKTVMRDSERNITAGLKRKEKAGKLIITTKKGKKYYMNKYGRRKWH